ncbi:MAG: hypothetical protein ACLU5J_03010 [Christensenellales bacterium]
MELKGYLEDKVSSKIIEDREQAIREAIVDSKEGMLFSSVVEEIEEYYVIVKRQ